MLGGFFVHRNSLTGTIPSLSGLTKLKWFFAWGNQLTGPIPNLADQTALEAFLVSHNQLTGAPPAAPSALAANSSWLCPNFLSAPSPTDAAWNIATGTTPWSQNCAAAATYRVTVNAGAGTANPVAPTGGPGATPTITLTPPTGQVVSQVSSTCGVTAGQPAAVTNGPLTSFTPLPLIADCTVTASFTVVSKSFSGTTVPASGSGDAASASFTGGGGSCGFDAANTAFIAAPAAPPAGQTLPQGMFKFKLVNCDNTPVSMNVTWPKPVTGYTKYGKASAGATQSSYFAPTALAISGNTATFTVQDGQQGDDDWVVNGSIVDPNGPTESATSTTSVTAVPTLGEWALMALGLLLAGLGARRVGRARLSS